MAMPTMVPAGWYPDPARRHQYRYWGGADWTSMVSDNAVTATDPLQSPLPSPALESPPPPPPPRPASPEAPVMAEPPSAEPVSFGRAISDPQPSRNGPVAYGQMAPTSAQPAQVVDPKLSAAVAEYAKRRYSLLSSIGSSVTMERPANKFNWFLAVPLLILLWPGLLLYVAIWAIWGVHRTYKVTLGLGPQGEVEEIGDVLAIFDRDRLQAHRKRCIGSGLPFAIIAALGALGVIVSLATGSWQAGLLGIPVLVLLPATIAALLFFSELKAARKLGMATSEWWRLGIDKKLTGAGVVR